jgi:hypothetical protein
VNIVENQYNDPPKLIIDDDASFSFSLSDGSYD